MTVFALINMRQITKSKCRSTTVFENFKFEWLVRMNAIRNGPIVTLARSYNVRM